MKFAIILRDIFDAVNTPGGHICVCLALIAVYARTSASGLEHDIVVFAIGVLSRSMGAASTPAGAEVSSVTTVTTPPTQP